MQAIQARPENKTPTDPSAKTDKDLPFLYPALEIKTGSMEAFVESLPFSFRDVTAGAENEFQAVVLGKREDVDLPITIASSNFFKNMVRRAASGDMSLKTLTALERYLEQKNNVWENSWVRFPEQCLNHYAREVFAADLRADKANPGAGRRSDAGQFRFSKAGETMIRVPVSYLLKLALADVIGSAPLIHPRIKRFGEKMMACFLNDNTSPEIFSFHPVRSGSGSRGIGRTLATETLIRFLFTQLLVQYAEQKLGLLDAGQQVRVYFSASPPVMQHRLNTCLSDAFYRYLFMSPCLSGWDRGEEKHAYMKLCHEVLSRSQINGIAKLKEAGIINSNLVILPSSSNISLANNGTHISIGSRKLAQLMADPGSGFNAVHEKHLGDLVIKVAEHFLCLFPGTYSASPFRLNFEDFHPEKILGFLPHELDYTHLRMIWRRWKKKAANRILGQPVTPFGPVWLDRFISTACGLKGDFVPDFRLVDYLVSLMSTDQSPALDGSPGNSIRLGKDLAQMGIFDTCMPLYQLVRLREFHRMGYSGFEHRYYSIFEDILTDMGGAADLQTLITALAYQYILNGDVTHAMIPDTPGVESERRQMFFCAAVNLPTFYVKTNTRNRFLVKIVSRIPNTRKSRRYPGYTRIKLRDYKQALIDILKTDGRALADSFRMQAALSDLQGRVNSPDTRSAGGRLVTGILQTQKKKNPMHYAGDTFNRHAETYYRDTLCSRHMAEGFKTLINEFTRMDLWASFREPAFKDIIRTILPDLDLDVFLSRIKIPLMGRTLSVENTKKLIFLIILYVGLETSQNESL
ncbi:MAG TPA: hypothetical protein VJ943_11400 [Desulfotignum sp.]|nr:hypothetical protein [Desulfotignum sp.]